MKPSLILVVLIEVLLVLPCATAAQESDEKAFLAWASQSLERLASVEADNDHTDLAPLRRMIGSARIVALSEAGHGDEEPLAFRNRLLKYLVDELGFTAIAIESGLTEGQVIHDYVLGGPGDLKSVLKQGLSWTFDDFPQNEALVRWLREYNAEAKHPNKVSFYGFDVPGSPGNSEATRGPSTALEAALDYLESVDSSATADFRARIGPLVQFMHLDPVADQGAEYQYTKLAPADRDKLTALIADFVSLFERRATTYAAASSDRAYQWAYRNALCARQVDAWLRQVPFNWKPAKPLQWSEWLWEAHEIRNRAMVDNLGWILERERAPGKILVFASRYHLAMTPLVDSEFDARGPYHPAGSYLKQEFGSRLVTIGHFFGNGAIGYRSIQVDVQPTARSFDSVLSRLTAPLFLLDLRLAPPNVMAWLERAHEQSIGAKTLRGSVARSFDILFFTRRAKRTKESFGSRAGVKTIAVKDKIISSSQGF